MCVCVCVSVCVCECLHLSVLRVCDCMLMFKGAVLNK